MFTSSNNGDGPTLSNESLITALEPLDLPLDSHVTLALPGPDQVLLQDVYRLVNGQSLTVTPPRHWRQIEGFSVGPQRDNYRGIVFPTTAVVSIVIIISIIIKKLASTLAVCRRISTSVVSFCYHHH